MMDRLRLALAARRATRARARIRRLHPPKDGGEALADMFDLPRDMIPGAGTYANAAEQQILNRAVMATQMHALTSQLAPTTTDTVTEATDEDTYVKVFDWADLNRCADLVAEWRADAIAEGWTPAGRITAHRDIATGDYHVEGRVTR